MERPVFDEQTQTDRLFLQEIINDLEKNGYVRGGKAQTMLHDWSRELRDRTPGMRGNTRRIHAAEVGANLY